ncbi:uncharacterized protein LOC143281116 isoform X2 [Babylonia areolata]|uniref:uncharacterized protein LOC143281116 isoform X2 n=1 Tax=Babylonia areolata TaxID=304850 RepID=UPI003FD28BBE
MADNRTTCETKGGGGSHGPRWSRWCFVWFSWWWVWSSHCAAVSAAENTNQQCEECPDIAVAVVVSVFVTLIVVAVALVIVYLVLRRRNGAFLFPPKRARKSLVNSDGDGNRDRMGPRPSCYENPAFSTGDIVDLEEGDDYWQPNRKNSTGKDPQRKRSTAVPGHTAHGSDRRGSSGSLDNPQPETVSVWLQSQDIIGLGFNICGNMRDGIFVSQVHNRGPAVESGKVQVGDRIRSVTITYDSMVYEDALTILSYASPYPVRLTLQKEKPQVTAAPSERRHRSSEQLNHPIYRSQSFDSLPHLPRDFHYVAPSSKTKRWQSEMKSETRGGRDSPRRDGEAGLERRIKALSQSLPAAPLGWDASSPDAFGVHSDVLVHAADSTSSTPSPSWYHRFQPKSSPREKKEKKEKESEPPSWSDLDSPVPGKRQEGKLDTEAARGFVRSEVDRALDNKDDDDEIFTSQTANTTSASPKTPPSKPERKKKGSSNASVVSDDSALDFSGLSGGVEELCVAVKSVNVHAALPPGLQDQDLGPEVEEEEIQPAVVKREVVINLEGFEFAPVEKPAAETAPEERPSSPKRYVYVKRPSRPASPERDPVEEDLIEAAAASRNTQAVLPRSQDTNNYSKTDAVKQAQDRFFLDEEALEQLILKSPPAENAGGWSGEFSGQDPAVGGPGSHVLGDAIQPSQSKAHHSSEDFITINMSGPGQTQVMSSSHSDQQLQHRSGNSRQNKANHEEGLEWSGQRLVRSGSFSEIPLDDSVSDWTDKNTLNDDDDGNIATPRRKHSAADDDYTDSDLDLDPAAILPSRGMYTGRENLANLSDLSNSLSSSRSSSPGLTNGPVGEGVQGGGGGLFLPGSNISTGGTARNATIELAPTSDTNANSKRFSFTLEGTSAADSDMDC